MKKLLLLASLLIFLTCTQDMVEEAESCLIAPTYENGIRPIVAANCSFSGCHDGASGVGNFKTYQGLQRDLENGNFQREVVDTRRMPLDGMLDEDDFEMIRCWLLNGYPEQ